MSEPLWQPRSERAARLLGLGFFTGGSGLLWFQTRAILGAVEGGGSVTYFHAAIALGEFGIVLGAYWMWRGLAGYQTVRALREKPVVLRWIGVASAIVVGGTLIALHYWLRSRGYTD